MADPESELSGGSDHTLGQQTVTNKTSPLHGNLDIWVRKANILSWMDKLQQRLEGKVSKLPGRNKRIEGMLPKLFDSKINLEEHIMSKKIASYDPYVIVSVSGDVIGRTFVINDSKNPVWMQHFNILVAHDAPEVLFVVKDKKKFRSVIIGAVRIPAEELCSGIKIEETFHILNDSEEICGELSLSIQYTPVEKVMNLYHDYQGIPGTYFPLRRGGKVTLYQDARVHDHRGCLPNLKLDGGVQYEHRDCWHDIFEAINQAQRLIYIAGWAVDHMVRLIRDGNGATGCTLGDLLKRKSQDGVKVLLLVWDDPSSISIAGYRTKGFMGTKDKETRHFFKNSSVQVLLCPRYAAGHSFFKKKEFEKIQWSHHQKTVIVDVDAGHCKRKIEAFVGGLDLCKGRYDTPNHPLFGTLQTVHKDDYHNPTFKLSKQKPLDGCPREPWHDLHCRIDGAAAYDVLTNFGERWLRASKLHGLQKLRNMASSSSCIPTHVSSHYDALLKIERIPDIIGMADIPCQSRNDPEGWHVQVFRSIDSNSVEGFPKDPKDATKTNLVCGKNVLIDKSIHTAYVNAIRRAQKFIYIENQFFIGSSYNWDSHKDLGANNLIPMEIALKIASKIKANERFSAYIIIPMWPEGVPTETSTQQILYWQYKTMEMMYEIIYEALKEVGLENQYEPQDYLNFFCLGNREAPDREDNLEAKNSTSAQQTPQALARKSRRFMIYVHSKGMIVDDEYIILGSANMNQRSMEGTRDTEIAIGAYQPNHTGERKHSSPHGQIYGYRISLWAEHTGVLEECFKQPESLTCVRQVQSISEFHWRQYVADEVTEMKGHLLRYPVEVDRTGKVKPLCGYEAFPDVGGNVTGTFHKSNPTHRILKNLTI